MCIIAPPPRSWVLLGWDKTGFLLWKFMNSPPPPRVFFSIGLASPVWPRHLTGVGLLAFAGSHDRGEFLFWIGVAGDSSLSTELRVRTCLEMSKNRVRYLSHQSAASFHMMSPDFDVSITECGREGGESCIWTMLALATVLQRQIVSVYPTINGETDEVPRIANTTLSPLNETPKTEPLFILWTRRVSDGSIPWTPTHFVPLMPSRPKGTPQAPPHTSSPAQESASHESKICIKSLLYFNINFSLSVTVTPLIPALYVSLQISIITGKQAC